MRLRSLLSASLLPLLAACGPRAPATPPTVEVVVPGARPSSSTVTPNACQRATARILSTLREPMLVTAWVTPGSPAFATFSRGLDELLTSYEELAPGQMHHRIVAVTTEEQRAAARNAGLQEQAFGEADSNGGAHVFQGFVGVTFTYRDEKEVIPLMPPDQGKGLGFWITTKIRETRDRADARSSRIGLLTGVGEIKTSEGNLVAAQGSGPRPNLRAVIEQALPYYKFEEVDLHGGASGVPRDLSGLVITQPGRDLTRGELRRIDEFLLLGHTSVAIFAGAVNVAAGDAGMKGSLDRHGLDLLLDGYGIELKKDALLDWARPAQVQFHAQGNPVKLAYPAAAVAEDDRGADERTQGLDPTFIGFFRMEEVVFPFPSTLVVHPDRQPGATLRVVARTSPRTTSVLDSPVDLRPTRAWTPEGEQGQRAIAVALEGKIKSAFGAGKSTQPSRLLVVSSSQFLANPWARAGNPTTGSAGTTSGDADLLLLAQPYAQQYLTETILAFKNTLDWMADDDDLTACSALLLGGGK